MKEKTHYTNGEKIFDQSGDLLTYYFKDGKVKAHGKTIDDLMTGEWRFYRETGDLWQVGNFSSGVKHGRWVRYHRNGELEFDETLENGKLAKRK